MTCSRNRLYYLCNGRTLGSRSLIEYVYILFNSFQFLLISLKKIPWPPGANDALSLSNDDKHVNQLAENKTWPHNFD